MLLKPRSATLARGVHVGFSTLYRVDAIEAIGRRLSRGQASEFQYPLSGRCY